MHVTKVITRCLLIVAIVSVANVNGVSAQNFNTRTWNTAAGSGYGSAAYGRPSSLVSSAYTAPADFAARSASYRVERDPRYLSALPAASPITRRASYNAAVTSLRPPYGGAGYGAGYGAGHGGYGGTCSTPPVYRGQGPGDYAPRLPAANPTYGYGVPAPRPAYSPYRVPEGYYRGDGIFGKDTVFAKNQPVRNFFRYIMP